MNRVTRIALLSVSLLMLVSCSSDDDDNDNNNGQSGFEAINGCSPGSADDFTGQSTVTITDQEAWGVPHGVCIEVDAGTTVTWEGNFDDHPLVGGTPGTFDPGSPITIASPQSGRDPVAVQFNSSGTYGYYCTIHNASMQGVVYVN